MSAAVPHLFSTWPEAARRIEAAPRLLACFDFDGTLVGIMPRPEDVVAGDEVRRALERLAGGRGTTVAVVSGRPLESLRAQVPADVLWLVGNHGLKTAAPGAPGEALLDEAEASAALDPAREALARIVAAHAGTRMEDKGSALALHTRQASREAARSAAEAWRRAAEGLADFGLLAGKEIWELRPRGVDKGRAVHALVERAAPGALVLYAGDDTTDEDVFAALSDHPDAVTVLVGAPRETRARARLEGPEEVLDLLGRLAALRGA